MELTKKFTDRDYERALESWEWLDLTGLSPQFTSLFGDVFLVGPDGGWWFLDTFEGEVGKVWDDAAALTATLETDQGQDRYLMGGLAFAARERRGLVLQDDEVYAYAPPPVISGSFDVEDIKVFKFFVVVNMAGQIHQKVRGA